MRIRRSMMTVGLLVAMILVGQGMICETKLVAQNRDSTDDLYKQAEAAQEHHDYATAFRLAMDLAKLGDTRGEDAVATYYTGEHGTHPGTPAKNATEALMWLKLAASQNDAWAQDTIGSMYAIGVLGAKNYVEAAKWERLAADQGFTDAQFALTVQFFDGKGVPKDYVHSYMWCTLALASADARHDNQLGTLDQMTTWRAEIAKRMTPEQIDKAQHLVDEWKPQVSKATCITVPAMCADQTQANFAQKQWTGSLANQRMDLSDTHEMPVELSQEEAQHLLRRKVPPVYSPLAKASRVSGVVVVNAVVNKEGGVEEVAAVEGPAMLRQAAMDSVKQWQYNPYLVDGRPVKFKTTVNVTFALSGN